MPKVGELLAFEASPYIGSEILGHVGPVIALSDDLFGKNLTVHVGSAFPAVDLLHYLFNVSPCDAVQMSSIEVPFEQCFVKDDVLGDESLKGFSIFIIGTLGIPTMLEEAPNIIVPTLASSGSSVVTSSMW